MHVINSTTQTVKYLLPQLKEKQPLCTSIGQASSRVRVPRAIPTHAQARNVTSCTRH